MTKNNSIKKIRNRVKRQAAVDKKLHEFNKGREEIRKKFVNKKKPTLVRIRRGADAPIKTLVSRQEIDRLAKRIEKARKLAELEARQKFIDSIKVWSDDLSDEDKKRLTEEAKARGLEVENLTVVEYADSGEPGSIEHVEPDFAKSQVVKGVNPPAQLTFSIGNCRSDS